MKWERESESEELPPNWQRVIKAILSTRRKIFLNRKKECLSFEWCFLCRLFLVFAHFLHPSFELVIFYHCIFFSSPRDPLSHPFFFILFLTSHRVTNRIKRRRKKMYRRAWFAPCRLIFPHLHFQNFPYFLTFCCLTHRYRRCYQDGNLLTSRILYESAEWDEKKVQDIFVSMDSFMGQVNLILGGL